MEDAKLASVCGFYCGSCVYLGNPCAGCVPMEGRPFWAEAMPEGNCPIYDCCRNEKKLEHCGLCPQMPCPTFLGLRDPSMSDGDFKTSLERRISNLRRRVEIGTEAWLKEVSEPES
jgi:hypothetical protein